MGIENFAAFMLTALLFVITPGIDTIFVLNKSIDQGKTSGVHAALGVNTGVLAHTLFAALGLSFIVAKSALAFTVLKYVGAIYLIYLGILKLKSGNKLASIKGGNKSNTIGKNNFVSGFVTNILNPKVALFFLAFFPQFIHSDQVDNPVPFILLGLTYAGIGTVWFLILSFFSGLFSKKFEDHPKAGLWINKFSGLVFILLGVKIALTKQ